MSRYADILDAARRNGTLPTPRPTPARESPPQRRPQVWTPSSEDEPEPPRPLATPQFRFARQLLADHLKLREFVIEGVLRQGETMNIIAPPKSHKSWMVLSLMLSIATGRPWLDRYRTARHRVLLLDNELHPEVIASRIRTVADAMSLRFEDYADNLAVDSLRGRLVDVHAMQDYVDQMQAGQFGFVVLDALYRFLPASRSENDNASMAAVYNRLDTFAGQLGCCLAAVHHSSKGSQDGKSVVDVGSGAGSQARAADSHLILRQHEEPDCFVLDAAVRSWAPIDPITLRWTFPIWAVADDLDPSQLKRQTPPNEERQAKRDAEGVQAVLSALQQSPQSSRNRIYELTGITPGRLARLLPKMERDELIRREPSVVMGNPADVFSLIE